MKKIIFPALAFLLSVFDLSAQSIQPLPPIPTRQQIQWQEMEFYIFVHFGPNTFTDKEWGHGDEPEDIFNPSDLDCRQWARIAKQAGAKGIIITAKHHDGFCLWPSKYSKHTVRESKWKNGKGDVLKDLSQACREYGLKFGVYISPWDRNHPQYGTPGYNDVFVNMMKEIFTRYGPIWELWWDGANGEGPNDKKQEYDWKKFETTVREISSSTVVFSDIGPDIRWVGNEKGIAGTTNWNLLDTAGFTRGNGAPATDTLNKGNMHGKNWIPAECDVSIRPGWFYHQEEDSKVKTPEQLFDLYLKSVGHGANLLLNVPPDRRGQIHPNDSTSLVDFKILRDANFKNNLAKNTSVEITPKKFPIGNRVTDESAKTNFLFTQYKDHGISFTFKEAIEINTIVLQEAIELGQRISAFEITLENNNTFSTIKGTTVGKKRIVPFPTQKVKSIVIRITDSKDEPVICEVAVYKIDDRLVGK